jgi:hypothetical protein
LKFSFTQWPRISAISTRTAISIPLFFAFFPIQTVFAWGPVGHETVAYIAMDNLTPAAKQQIASLLPPGITLAAISNWADEIRNYRRETGPWHYIDLPIRKDITVKDEQNYCPDGNCILDQLKIDETILGDPTIPQPDRLEALKFVVHFMGDLHMPLHCADDGDRGGNDKLVRFRTPGSHGHGLTDSSSESAPQNHASRLEVSSHGAKIQLHALWDRLIEIKTPEDPRELATTLEKAIPGDQAAAWTMGDEKDWAFESYQIAKSKIYVGMDPGPQDYTDNPLPSDYFDKMRPIVNHQLEKAGLRLAFVLNEILK